MSFIISPPYDASAYERIVAEGGGDPRSVFVELGIPIAQRYLRQTGLFPRHTDLIEPLLKTVWDVVHAGPLPKPLQASETGEAMDPDEDFVRDKVAHVAELIEPQVPEAIHVFTYQLMVALTQPEFKACRLSYQEANIEGVVERQDASYCEDRISGSHCEDCPYYVALSQEKHEKLMRKQWLGGAEAFEAAKDVFLPNDFRMMRVFWYLHLRASSGGAQT